MDNQNNTFESEATPSVPEKKEVNVVAIVLGVIAGIFAIVAAVFMVKNFTEKPKCETEVVVQESEKVIDNELAQNLIKPYIRPLKYMTNLLDVGFDDGVKLLLAYGNDTYEDKKMYREVNSEYQYLFGDGSSLAKKDYSVLGLYTFTYDDTLGYFELTIPNNGGTASTFMFTVVKDAVYDENGIIVNVYHDNKIQPCYVDENGGYCVKTELNTGIIDSIEEYNMRDLIEKFGDKIPVYKMIFTKNAGHYVLSEIEKPATE